MRVDTFHDEPLYPRIARAAEQILAESKVVAPVHVLVRINLLAPERLKDWRYGCVPYPEKDIGCDLVRLSGLLRTLQFHAHDLKHAPSTTAYSRWCKDPKGQLRFTQIGDPKLKKPMRGTSCGRAKQRFTPLTPPATTGRMKRRRGEWLLGGIPDIAESRPSSRVNS